MSVSDYFFKNIAHIEERFTQYDIGFVSNNLYYEC